MYNNASEGSDNQIDRFGIRHSSLSIATFTIAVGEAVFILFHIVHKGAQFWWVPVVASIGIAGALSGMFVSRETRNARLGGAVGSIFFAVAICLLAAFTDGLQSPLLPIICAVPAFAASYWSARGAMWLMVVIVGVMGLLWIFEAMQVMDHEYFLPFPDLRNQAYFLSVVASLVMIGTIGFSFVREQNTIKRLLIKQTEQSKMSEDTRTRFLENMTHELRTPLNGISGVSALMELELLSENQQEYLSHIKSSTEELDALIENLLIVSAGNNVVNMERIDPFALPQRLSLDSVIFKWIIQSDLAEVNLPLSAIQNILVLILKTSKMRLSEAPITVRQKCSKHVAIWWIEDQGAKMSPEQFQLISNSFERHEDALGVITSHAQLGLGFATEIASKIGAEVEYTNDGDKSYFKLTYPFL